MFPAGQGAEFKIIKLLNLEENELTSPQKRTLLTKLLEIAAALQHTIYKDYTLQQQIEVLEECTEVTATLTNASHILF